MRTRLLFALVTLAGVGTAAAPAQAPTVDSRWLAYLGCWRSIEIGREAIVCLVPAAETSAIDLVTIDSGRVVAAEQIAATGQRTETAGADCSGWQRAQWSEVSDRVYLSSEETCPGGGTRRGTGLIALTHEGHLLYIQGNTVAAKTGVRVQRYREGPAVDLPSEVKDALTRLGAEVTATARARAAGAAPLTIDDLAEASRALNVEVLQAWLIARGEAFNLDAKRLIALAEAGVPPRITDLMIALSNPGVFVVDASARQARRTFVTTETAVDGPVYIGAPVYSGSCYGFTGFVGSYDIFPFSSAYCDGYAFAYPYPYGWFPVTILYTGGSIGGS
ncbi:MAG TPA: hypothetical protein VFO67_22685, partial [Gemmatimonadales bacterium]|nr:hypothetical protein [Gemmatimonadales bacterium]